MPVNFISVMNQLDPTVWGSFFGLGFGVVMIHFIGAKLYGTIINMIP